MHCNVDAPETDIARHFWSRLYYEVGVLERYTQVAVLCMASEINWYWIWISYGETKIIEWMNLIWVLRYSLGILKVNSRLAFGLHNTEKS